MILTALLLIVFMTNNGALKQHLLVWQQGSFSRPLTMPGEELPPNPSPSLSSTWPLIIFWGLIGILTYTLSSYIVHTFQRSLKFKKTFHEIEALPASTIEQLIEHMLLRCVAFIVVAILLVVLLKSVVPYIILLTQASASNFVSINGLAYSIFSVIILVASLHIIVVFMRLSFGKNRIF